MLVDYCNGVDALLAGGVTTFDAMLPHIINQLPNFENDPVVVTAMREAMHHNLYALANSSAMNGVGANTTIKPVKPIVLTFVLILACGGCFFFLVGLAGWILGSRKLKKTAQYQEYKAARANYEAAKKAK